MLKVGKFNLIGAGIALSLISGMSLCPAHAESIDDSYYQRVMAREPRPSQSSRPPVSRDRNYYSRHVEDTYDQTVNSGGHSDVPSRPQANLDRDYYSRHIDDSYYQQVTSERRGYPPSSTRSIDYGRLIPDGGIYYPVGGATSPAVVYQYGIQASDLPWNQRGFKEVTGSSNVTYRLKNDRLDVILPRPQQSTAVLVVHLPLGASLQVDSQQKEIGDPHIFHTPPLAPGLYGYTFKVTLPTGQVVEERVKFKPGEVRGVYLESAGINGASK